MGLLRSRVRVAQRGCNRRTHIIATLVQSAALWGTPGAEMGCSKVYGEHHDQDGPRI